MATATKSTGFGYVSSKQRTGPDPAVVKDQLFWLQSIYKLLGDADFCRSFLWILRKKDEPDSTMTMPEGFWNRRLVPFVPNRVQLDMINREKKRNICLKYRQGGYTTDKIIRRLYIPAITQPGSGCLLISQNHFYAAQHFAILKRTHRYFGTSNPYDFDACRITRWFHDHLLHTVASNRRELIFDQLDSKILIDSAEQEETGQGLTVQHLVATEVSRWPGKPEETLANVKESMPDDGTIDEESTANGFGGYFFDECMRARDPLNTLTEFNYFFHEWWWHDEYQAKHIEAKIYRSGDSYIDFEKNPLTDEEKELRKRADLNLNQIAWRRVKKASLRHNFDEKYPEDDITAFLVSGKSFFDRDILRYRLMELKSYEPMLVKRGGEFKMFHKRIKGRKYVIGADTATGRQVSSEDTDFSAAVVLDEETGEEMASIRGRMPPEDYAEDLMELGEMYNNAMIAVERGTGGDGGVVLYKLEERKYWNIYKHRDRFKARAVDQKQRKYVEVPGLPMTPKTRPIACNRLREFVEKHPERFFDITFFEEALTFVRDSKGKPVGGGDEDNAKDDCVMARAIAFLVRLEQLGLWDPELSEKEKYGQEPIPEDEAPGESA